MGTRLAYFYFMKKEADKIQSVVPLHVEYWRQRNLKGYMGGPFADRSGGLITFEAESIVVNDPFVSEDLLEEKWIKEWMVE
jgi:uncharacterized protein YciI